MSNIFSKYNKQIKIYRKTKTNNLFGNILKIVKLNQRFSIILCKKD